MPRNLHDSNQTNQTFLAATKIYFFSRRYDAFIIMKHIHICIFNVYVDTNTLILMELFYPLQLFCLFIFLLI